MSSARDSSQQGSRYDNPVVLEDDDSESEQLGQSAHDVDRTSNAAAHSSFGSILGPTGQPHGSTTLPSHPHPNQHQYGTPPVLHLNRSGAIIAPTTMPASLTPTRQPSPPPRELLLNRTGQTIRTTTLPPAPTPAPRPAPRAPPAGTPQPCSSLSQHSRARQAAQVPQTSLALQVAQAPQGPHHNNDAPAAFLSASNNDSTSAAGPDVLTELDTEIEEFLQGLAEQRNRDAPAPTALQPLQEHPDLQIEPRALGSTSEASQYVGEPITAERIAEAEALLGPNIDWPSTSPPQSPELEDSDSDKDDNGNFGD